MKAIESCIRPFHANPTLVLNGEPVPPVLYGLTDSPGSRWTWEEVPTRNIRLFAERGVRLFQFDLWLQHMLMPDGSLDISLARKQVRGVLDAAPGCPSMIRLHLTAPPEWCLAHPEECVAYANADPKPENPFGLIRPLANDLDHPTRASLFSSLWKTEATRYLEQFCRELAATPEGDAVFSIQIADGTYGEWHQYGFLNYEPDVGPAARNAFIDFLRKRYGDIETLNRVWNAELEDFSEVAIPGLDARHGMGPDGLLDPATQQAVIDFHTFTQEDMADLLLHWADRARASWPRSIVIAAFFGYFFSAFGRMAQCGHLAFEKLLASDAVDCLCAPQSYRLEARRIGGTGQPRGMVGPVIRAGKLWLDEMDEATSLGGNPWFPESRTNLEQDVAIVRRNVLHPFTRGGGLWFYDFGPNTATSDFPTYGVRGAWDDPTLAAEIEGLSSLVQDRLSRESVRPADVLVVHDPMSMTRISAAPIPKSEMKKGYIYGEGDPVTLYGIDALSESLHHSGLIHEEALLAELPTLDLSPYRLIIFATALVIPEPLRKAIAARLEESSALTLFCGYCGCSDGQSLDLRLASEFTGFALQKIDSGSCLEVEAFGFRGTLQLQHGYPRIALKESAHPIANWDTGSPAAAWDPGRRAAYFAVPPADPDLLRALGREAGCHVWNDDNDATLVGRGLLVVHTHTGGSRSLQLPGGKTLSVQLAPDSTSVFDAVSGAPLL